MSKPFFSVILPLHNAAGYMRRMLDSIRRQSFTDYELILICDSCTDDTAKIAMEYSNIVLEVDFGKAGLSRNAGLDIAKGEWILFSDDDDWWLHDYAFETIHERLEPTGAPVANSCNVLAFGFYWRMGSKSLLTSPLHPRGHPWVAPWSKAWRRSFIGEHRFPAWKHSDDLGFAEEMYPLMTDVDLDCLYAPLYYYNYMHEGSIQDRLAKGELSYDDMRE